MINLVYTYITRGNRGFSLSMEKISRERRTGWCHLSVIPGTAPHCLVSTEGNVNFLGARKLVYAYYGNRLLAATPPCSLVVSINHISQKLTKKISFMLQLPLRAQTTVPWARDFQHRLTELCMTHSVRIVNCEKLTLRHS